MICVNLLMATDNELRDAEESGEGSKSSTDGLCAIGLERGRRGAAAKAEEGGDEDAEAEALEERDLVAPGEVGVWPAVDEEDGASLKGGEGGEVEVVWVW